MARKPTEQDTAAPAPAAAPTPADVTAIGQAAQTAAVETTAQGGTPEQAGDAAAQAAQATANERGIELPPHIIDQIAKATAAATVAELAEQGAVMPPAPPAEAERDEDDGDEDKPGDDPPRKTTFAERVLGAYNR